MVHNKPRSGHNPLKYGCLLRVWQNTHKLTADTTHALKGGLSIRRLCQNTNNSRQTQPTQSSGFYHIDGFYKEDGLERVVRGINTLYQKLPNWLCSYTCLTMFPGFLSSFSLQIFHFTDFKIHKLSRKWRTAKNRLVAHKLLKIPVGRTPKQAIITL